MREYYKKIDGEMSERLNIMKFIFMLMVVFIHSDALPELPFELELPKYVVIFKNFIVDGICTLAISGFFFIAGFLLFSREFSWWDNMKKKLRSIVLPYCIVNTFWILFFKVMQSCTITAAWFSGNAYQINGIKGLVRAFYAPIPLYYPFWFLRDLFILNIIAGLIKKCISKMPVVFFIIVIGVGVNVITLPFLVSTSSFCMFTMGYYAGGYLRDVKELDRIKLWELCFAFLAIIFCRLYIYDDATIGLVYSFEGILLFYRLSGIIYKSKFSRQIIWCSQFSFFIYITHEFYEAMMKKIVMIILPQYGFVQILEFLILPIAVSAFCIVAGAAMKKYLNPLFYLVCGYRKK